MFLRTILAVTALCGLATVLHATASVGISIQQTPERVTVRWPMSADQTGVAVFNLDEKQPLINSLGVAAKDQPAQDIVTHLDPTLLLTVGERDLKNPAGWVAFFDNPPLRPHQTFLAALGKRRAQIISSGATRATVSVAEISAGSFHGDLRFTFYRHSPLIHAEAVVSTEEDGRAIIYDTGLTSAAPDWKSVSWNDPAGAMKELLAPDFADVPTENVAVAGRTIAVKGAHGSLAAFPAPHQFFYPQDEAFNLKFVWYGKGYGGKVAHSGFGIRQSPTGDKRFVPWYNALPGAEQHLSIFYLLSPRDPVYALEEVARYTHGDHYKPLPGYLTYTSHYHVEHTFEFLRRQKEEKTDGVPKALATPGMVKTFKARGVNIVHLAEFHAGPTPDLPDDKRLPLLKILHEECQRLSDDALLLLPGEEPNVHLGGHWLSLFPKPVYWVLNRPAGTPFAQETPGYGTVYHVGSADDVLQLMEREHGLMWTAHPRIKASIGYPDKYKDRDFFKSDRFLGGAWKAMPADLSQPRLGKRVLDLQDDMSSWGLKKQTPGEADLFRMEPDFETYAHMNVNYLRLDKLPKFEEGWQPVLDALRGGQFFTTTGEILIPKHTVGTLTNEHGPMTNLFFVDLEWTFPLAYAEVISGDGKQIYRQRIELSDTEQFGTRRVQTQFNTGCTWARIEVWDVAANGAYTQPVWLNEPRPASSIPTVPMLPIESPTVSPTPPDP